MAKKLAKLLKTDSMGDLDTKVLAQILKSKGRKGDTMLAHINPQEAALLKKRGGSGTKNPETGLPEFYDDGGNMSYAEGEAIAYGNAAPPTSNYSFSYGGDYFGGDYSPQDFANRVPEASAMNTASANFTPPAPESYQDVTSPAYVQAMTGYYQQPEMPTDVMGNKVIVPVSGSYAPGMPPSVTANINRPPPPGVQQPGAPGVPGAVPAKDDSFFNKEFLQKLGLAGVAAVPGIYQARQAQKQGQRGKAEQQALADPYRKESQALLEKARSGELNAVGQQQLQQLEARLRQGQESRGGVGNAQVQAQVEAFRQQLLQNQYDLGLKVSGIADQIALGAIKTGMEADRYVGELTGNYYNNMFRILSGAQLQPTPTRGA